jgi:hypothetical protein
MRGTFRVSLRDCTPDEKKLGDNTGCCCTKVKVYYVPTLEVARAVKRVCLMVMVESGHATHCRGSRHDKWHFDDHYDMKCGKLRTLDDGTIVLEAASWSDMPGGGTEEGCRKSGGCPKCSDSDYIYHDFQVCAVGDTGMGRPMVLRCTTYQLFCFWNYEKKGCPEGCCKLTCDIHRFNFSQLKPEGDPPSFDPNPFSLPWPPRNWPK